MVQNQNIVGLETLNLDKLQETQIINFIPYLTYFVFSVYIKSQLTQWVHDDIQFQDDLLRSSKHKTETMYEKLKDNSDSVVAQKVKLLEML